MALSSAHTVYLSNLNESVKIDKLKEDINALLINYGEIVTIRASKRFKLKGQAFVIFKDVASAQNAVSKLEGCLFLGKPLKITFAKNESHFLYKYQMNASETKVLVQNDELPTCILMVTSLPASVSNKRTLEDICSKYPDFQEVRLVPNRLDVAYIEFENPVSATSAKEALEKLQLSVSYAPNN